MKLSICIPVFNFDVNELINDLQSQINSNLLDAEIILIDDASTQEFINLNKNLEKKVNRFIFLDTNIGRSRIRNLFLKYAQSEYLLFLDCDGKIIRKDFLKVYCDFIDLEDPDVIFGGRQVSDIKPNSEFGLRWKFANQRENLPVIIRRKSPYLDFQTNNFVVKKSILQKIPFNEGITQYGYEDLIFSKDLRNNQIEIDHIDNPIFNNDLETNELFLEKADQSAKSLAQLIKNDQNFERVGEIKLAKAYILMQKTGTVHVYSYFYNLTKSKLKKILLSGAAPLKVLDAYKLGQLIGYMNNSPHSDRN